jgi:hypothetical protein
LTRLACHSAVPLSRAACFFKPRRSRVTSNSEGPEQKKRNVEKTGFGIGAQRVRWHLSALTSFCCSKEKDTDRDEMTLSLPRDRPITACNQIGGTQRTRVRRRGCFPCRQCSIWIFLCGSPGRVLSANIRYLRLDRLGSSRFPARAVMLSPLRDQYHGRRCDVVAPDLTDFMQLGPLSPWSRVKNVNPSTYPYSSGLKEYILLFSYAYAPASPSKLSVIQRRAGAARAPYIFHSIV